MNKTYSKKSKKSVFENKKRLYPKSCNRLPVFYKNNGNNIYGKFEILEGSKLTQTHIDVLEAIATTGKRGIYKDNIRYFYVFDMYELLKFLGHKKIKHHAWIFEKLAEIRSVNIKIETKDFGIIGGIIDHFAYTKLKRDTEKKYLFGENKLFGVVFSEIFSKLFEKDLIVYATKDVVKSIININHDFIKLLVRFCLTHEQINMKLQDILKHLNIDIADRTLRKYKLLLIKHKDYLKQNFNIDVISKENIIYIFYKKDVNKIAIDYNRDYNK